mgnify:CR=1 FL=1
MDFELSEEHRAFRDMVTRWVDSEAPKSWARELERDEWEYPFALWDKFTEAGFHGIGIDEKYGGQGGDVVMQMLLARAVAPVLGSIESMVPSMVAAMIIPMTVCLLELTGVSLSSSSAFIVGATGGIGIFLLLRLYAVRCRKCVCALYKA